MGDDGNKDMLNKLDEIAKELRRTAEALTVVKVAIIAIVIASLAVVFKNFF